MTILLFLLILLQQPVYVEPAPVASANVITKRYRIITFSNHTELGRVSGDGKVITINPKLASVCRVSRYRRNLIAAASDSKKALSYLKYCQVRYDAKFGVPSWVYSVQ